MVSDRIKNKIQLYYVFQRHVRFKDTNSLKEKGWEKISHADSNHKKAGLAMLISDEVNFRTKNITTGKKEHFIIKRSVPWEGVTIISMHI